MGALVAKVFNWNRYYTKRIARMNYIDIRLANLRKEAKELMAERIALVREGYPDERRSTNHSAGA
jgi:predicted membrane-bound dolichyl-phosphate-mannose-protein mannosyltransferase